MKLIEYLNEMKQEDGYDTVTIKGKKVEQINWKYHFEAYGGFKQFLKATGLKEDAVRIYMTLGEVPESARKKIRSAVAKRIINKPTNEGVKSKLKDLFGVTQHEEYTELEDKILVGKPEDIKRVALMINDFSKKWNLSRKEEMVLHQRLDKETQFYYQRTKARNK